jgi:hypothetical protein
MSCRAARVAFVLALAAGSGIAAGADTAPDAPLDRMTPTQLRVLQATLDRDNAATREQNAALGKRLAALERDNAALRAEEAKLESRLAQVRERLAKLAATRKD